MIVLQCPDVLNSEATYNKARIFVAGGISGCKDWQKEMIARFKEVDDDLVLINPRRDNFNILALDQSNFQIDWEYDHIHKSDAMIFWFPFETLCPITLYELGVAAERGVPLFVGCHPAYQRVFDVKKQLSRIRPDVTVHDNFEPIVNDAIEWYNAW